MPCEVTAETATAPARGRSGKTVPEGVEARSPTRAPFTSTSTSSLAASDRVGIARRRVDLADLRAKARFVRITNAGLIESHPHNVTITQEPPEHTRCNSGAHTSGCVNRIRSSGTKCRALRKVPGTQEIPRCRGPAVQPPPNALTTPKQSREPRHLALRPSAPGTFLNVEQASAREQAQRSRLDSTRITALAYPPAPHRGRHQRRIQRPHRALSR